METNALFLFARYADHGVFMIFGAIDHWMLADGKESNESGRK